MPRAIQFKTKDGRSHTIRDHSLDCVCGVCNKDFTGTSEKGGAIFGETLVCKKCAIAIIKVRNQKPVEVCKKDELFTSFAMKHAICVGEIIAKIIDKHGSIIDSNPEDFPNVTKQSLTGGGYKTMEISKSNEWDSSQAWDDDEGES